MDGLPSEFGMFACTGDALDVRIVKLDLCTPLLQQFYQFEGWTFAHVLVREPYDEDLGTA